MLHMFFPINGRQGDGSVLPHHPRGGSSVPSLTLSLKGPLPTSPAVPLVFLPAIFLSPALAFQRV